MHYKKKISEKVKNADQDTLVVFEVDNFISAPSNLIRRPKVKTVRRAISKEYEQKYGKDRIVHIRSFYYPKASKESFCKSLWENKQGFDERLQGILEQEKGDAS